MFLAVYNSYTALLPPSERSLGCSPCSDP